MSVVPGDGAYLHEATAGDYLNPLETFSYEVNARYLIPMASIFARTRSSIRTSSGQPRW